MHPHPHGHAHSSLKRPIATIVAAALLSASILPFATLSDARAQTPPGGTPGQGPLQDILDRTRERDAQLDRLDRERRQAEENRRRNNPPPPPPQSAPMPAPTPAAEKGIVDRIWDFFFGNEEEENRERREEFRRRIEEARRQREEERRRAEESQPQRSAEAEKTPPAPVTPPGTAPTPSVVPPATPRRAETPPPSGQRTGLRTMQRETRMPGRTASRVARNHRVMTLARHAPVRSHPGFRATMSRGRLTAAQLNALDAARHGRSAYASERQQAIAGAVLQTGLGIALGGGMGRMGGHYGRMGAHHGMSRMGMGRMGMGGNRMMGMGRMGVGGMGRMGRF